MTIVRNSKELLEDLKDAKNKTTISLRHKVDVTLGKIKTNLPMWQINYDLKKLEGQLSAYDHAIELVESLIFSESK